MLPYIARHNLALCTGCGACAQVCPEACITMQRDAEGFAYPHIDADRCTECGLCESVCPASGDWRALHETARQPTLYAAWHLDDEVRRKSSSGGVFTALARAMLDEGGVVYGAGFDDMLQLRHVGITGEEGLTALRGSKYLQSDTGATFREAQSHLEAGRPVLYSGTPCQIAGLYAFLGNAPAGLVTVDFICHGVPSALLFERYLDDARGRAGGQIRRVDFRDKRRGWRRYHLTLCTTTGLELSQPATRDPFQVGFLRNLCLRPSCHACPYACVQRVADITLGDFWAIGRCHPELDDDQGVSEVLLNTPQGQQMFEACRDQLFTRECRLEDGMQGNLRTPSVAAPERAAFFRDLAGLSFDELHTKYLRPRRRSLARRVASRAKRTLAATLCRLAQHRQAGRVTRTAQEPLRNRSEVAASRTPEQEATLVHITTVPQSLAFVRGQVGYMQARGFQVHAISSPGPRLDAFGREAGVTTHAVEMPRRITPWQDIRALARLSLLLRTLRPTIVHAHTPKGGLLGMVAAWLARVPVRIYHMRGLPCLAAEGFRRAILRCTERLSCAAGHQVIAISPSIARVAVEEGLCPAEKIKPLHHGGNGLDAIGVFNPEVISNSEVRARYGLPPDAQVIGFVGRVVRDKGVAERAEAWGLLSERYPNAHLLIVGPIEPQDPVPPSALQRLERDSRVHLTGRVPKGEMPAILAAMQVLALPTYREGLPNVPLEASAMEIPVVATNIPGCVDAVIDGVTGTLVPPRDPAALTQAIARYLDDPDLRRRHGQAGRQRVLRDFRPEDVWEATYQEYLRLLRERGLPIPEPKDAHP